jgi:hypothetical protein
MTTKPLTVKQRVANGARWLDENFPGWEGRIDINTLRLSEGRRCICGQVFEKNARRSRKSITGYEYAVDNLFSEANSWISTIVKSDPISRRSTKLEKEWRAYSVARSLGFLLDTENDILFQDLQEEWVKLLHRRERARAKAAKAITKAEGNA